MHVYENSCVVVPTRAIDDLNGGEKPLAARCSYSPRVNWPGVHVVVGNRALNAHDFNSHPRQQQNSNR